MKKININEMIEELSELEHKQWWDWSSEISRKEKLSKEREERWEKLWIPYNELDEKDKNSDREYAYKVLAIIMKYI